jgi:lipid-A-disaccharide synthase-like uncharacterized protein
MSEMPFIDRVELVFLRIRKFFQATFLLAFVGELGFVLCFSLLWIISKEYRKKEIPEGEIFYIIQYLTIIFALSLVGLIYFLNS